MLVDSQMHPATGPIDAVITWVDGGDPRHAAGRREALARRRRLSLTAIPGGKSPTRFSDNGELRYCIASIRRFMPWIRTIFLLTDDQRPGFLTTDFAERHGVRVVDHTQVFRGHEDVLPTFNSQSIETAMHRIEGLADRFVYFNDDVFVLEPTGPEEFFADGGVVLRGQWAPLRRFGPARMLLSSALNHLAHWRGIVRSMAVLPQYRSAERAGFRDRLLLAPHVPHPLRRRTLERYFEEQPDAFARNIAHRFRDMRQFVPVGLANHLEIARGTWRHSAAGDDLLICFNRDSRPAIEEKLRILRAGHVRFLCLQGLDNAAPEFRAVVDTLLAERIGAST